MRRRRGAAGGSGSGPSTDATGAPVVDPTDNVLREVASNSRRQDDLREKESKHIRELLGIRAEHDRELREAESARIDAIRQVDVTAVQQAAGVAETRAAALATTVAASAEAMRSQVAAAASAAATALASALSPITVSVEQLRQAMYEAAGQKAQVIERRDIDASQFGPAVVVICAVALMTYGVMRQLGRLSNTAEQAVGAANQGVQDRQRGSYTAVWVAVGISIFAIFATFTSMLIAVLIATKVI